jgi:hypothetical protein
VQEHAAVKIAHRTSPTNMGLALLANLTAHDFGYISTGKLVARTTNALSTMESLERHRGHFYNWYDTQTRLPLAPLYVSTVDSGNLVGHLLTLRPGLTALCDAPILNRRWIEGLSDTSSILVDALGQDLPDSIVQFEMLWNWRALPSRSIWSMRGSTSNGCAARADDAAAQFGSSETIVAFWARSLAAQCTELRDDLVFVAPWLAASATVSRFQMPAVFQRFANWPRSRHRAP